MLIRRRQPTRLDNLRVADRKVNSILSRNLLDTAVLLVTWNRPDTTKRVLSAIREAKPSRLFVAGDGPRNEEDARLIAEVKKTITGGVDWECEVLTSYSTTNLGCRGGVTRAIDWFFSHVDEGIILEDDCVPHPHFFRFSAEMLGKYRDNTRVMHIAGDNSAQVRLKKSDSYCFIRYPHIWGWATWSRAWKLYDRDLRGFREIMDCGQIDEIFPNNLERKIWVPIFDKLERTNQPDTWDWRWSATVFINDGLSVQPLTNLVSNIGHGDDSTHTKRKNLRAEFPRSEIFPLAHPTVITRELDAEKQVLLNTQTQLIGRGLLRRVFLKARSLLRFGGSR